MSNSTQNDWEKQDVAYWINELIEKRCDRVYCRMKIEEIQAKERADARKEERMKAEVETGLKNFQVTMEEISKTRKEVIKRIEAMPDKDVRPEITVWLESKEYCLGYNKALSNVLATLREEGAEK